MYIDGIGHFCFKSNFKYLLNVISAESVRGFVCVFFFCLLYQ